MTQADLDVRPSDAPGAPAEGLQFSAGYRRWLLVFLALIYTCNFVDRSIFSSLAQSIKRDLHLSDTQLGLLSGLTFATLYTLLGIPLARLVERRSRIAVMTACVCVWSAMTALCGLAQSFVQLALARVGVGVGEAGCLPAAHSLISDHFPPSQRATALAVFSMGIPLGSFIGAVAGGWIALHTNWRMAFVAVGLPGLVLALMTPLTLKEPPRGHVEGMDGSEPPPSLVAVFRLIWLRRAWLWVAGGAACAATANYGVLAFFAAYFARRFGLDSAQAGLAAGLISGLGAAVSIMGGGVLADWAARRDKRAYAWVAVTGLLLATPLYIAGFTRPDWPSALTLLVVGAALQQLYLAPTFAIANNMAGPRWRATSVALMAAVWSILGLGFGPLIVGALSDVFRVALSGSGGADVLGLCQRAGCADASATGLQYALIAITAFFGLGALFYAASARRLREDLARPKV